MSLKLLFIERRRQLDLNVRAFQFSCHTIDADGPHKRDERKHKGTEITEESSALRVLRSSAFKALNS